MGIAIAQGARTIEALRQFLKYVMIKVMKTCVR